MSFFSFPRHSRSLWAVVSAFFVLLAVVAPAAAAGEQDAIVAVVKRFAKVLGDGKHDPGDHPEMVLSPFCPPEKGKRYAEGLQALAGVFKGCDLKVDDPVVVEGDFAGCLVVAGKADNPLSFEVRPLCLLKTKGGWKVAAGLSHFDNTNLGFEAGRAEAAGALAARIRTAASVRQEEVLDRAAASVRRSLATIRADRLARCTREQLVAAYLEFDRKHDVMGKLACLLVPDDLQPRVLSRMLAELVHPVAPEGRADGGGKEGGEPMRTVFVGFSELDGQTCHGVGFINLRDPADYFVLPFYVIGHDGGGWRMFPFGLDLYGLPTPDDRLVEWFGMNESVMSLELMRKVAAGERGAPSAEEAHRRFFEAALRRDGAAVLACIPLAPVADDETEALDAQLAAVGGFWSGLRATGSPEPLARQTAIRTDGSVCIAAHAVFQPFAGGGPPFRTLATLAVNRDDRWWVQPCSTPEDLPWQPWTEAERDALRKLQSALAKEAPSDETVALQFFGAPWRVPEADGGAPAEARAGDPELQAFAAKLAGHAGAGELASLLEMAVQPPGARNDRGLHALREVAEVVRDCRPGERAKAVVDGVAVSGNWGGLALTLPQPKREDGRVPMRMLVASRQPDGWRWVPGLQFFREVNRGYKALNVKELEYWKETLGPAGMASVGHLRTWLESNPPAQP